MKHILITTIAVVVLVGCGESQQSAPAPEAKPEPPTAKAPDIDIWTAAGLGKIEAVKQHLAAGTDVNARRKKNFNSGTMTPLDLASNSLSGDNRTEVVNFLKKHGGKMDDWFNAHESIHKAASGGNIEALKQHLAAGVDVNSKTSLGETPLQGATYSGHKEIVELLIAKGADVNAMDFNKGNSLLNAVSRSHKEIVELLIAKGADVNVRDLFGRALLHFSKTKEITELLISAGADVNAKNETGAVKGETPLDFAIHNDETEIADLLRKHGGKTKKELKAEGK